MKGESGSDYSPNKLPHSILIKSISPPPVRYQRVAPSSSTIRKNVAAVSSSSGSILASSKYQMPRYPEEQALHQVKPAPLLSSGSVVSGTTSQLTAGGTLSGIKRYEMTVINGNRDSSLGKTPQFITIVETCFFN